MTRTPRRFLPALLVLGLAAGLAGCGQRDALLAAGAPPRDRREVELAAGGAVLLLRGAFRPIGWEGGDWALTDPFQRPELLRVDGGVRRHLSAPFDPSEIDDVRLAGDLAVFRRRAPGRFAAHELWRFDPQTAITTRLPGFGVDKLFARPGHDTLLVRGWQRPDATGEPTTLREVDPRTGLTGVVPHLPDHHYPPLAFDAGGAWYFVSPKRNPRRLTAVPLEGGAPVPLDSDLPLSWRLAPIDGGIAIADDAAVSFWRPPEAPGGVYQARGDEVLGAPVSVLGGDGIALVVTPEDEGSRLLLIDATTGERRYLSSGFGQRSIEAVSPDGRWLFERGSERTRALWVHDLLDPAAEARRIPAGAHLVVGFSADSAHVLLTDDTLYPVETLSDPVDLYSAGWDVLPAVVNPLL